MPTSLRIRRYAFCLLLPVFLFALTAAAAPTASDTAQEEKTNTVEVHLREHVVDMPATLPAGPTTFLVHNDGGKNHSLKIEGPGVDALLAAPLRPHENGKLEVTLQPGEYKVYCPVGSHAAKGMTMKLAVTAKSK
jgi:plastocyanin